MLSLTLSTKFHGPVFFLPHTKHILDILTCACDCVIHSTLTDTVSVLVCETLRAQFNFEIS